jgi:hypothetical protein
VSSIHTTEDRDSVENPTNAADSVDAFSSPDPRLINPLEAGNKYLYAQARRKRKPGPSVRSAASGPQKFRNRNHVVVYYDGYLQEQLDAMVKQIGVGRNNLRKGKNALAAATGFRLPALPKAAGLRLSMFDDTRPALMSRSTSALLPTEKADTSTIIQPPADEASFVQADKDLDQIQSLCETAAHQFLRDGDCRTELGNIRQRLDALLVYATATAELLSQLRASQEAAQVDSDGTLSTKSSVDLLSTSGNGLTSSSPLISSHPLDSLKSQGFFSAPVIPALDSSAALTTDTIEVDDASDQESIVVDLSQYRLQNPRRIRA